MSTSPAKEATARPTVTALRFYKRGDIRLDQLELPVAYSGVCGTDVTEYLGGPIFPPQEGHTNPHTGVSPPVILGYEFSGTICERGSNVHDLQLGQPVVVSPAYNHRRYHGSEFCETCQTPHYNICDASATIGLNAPGGGFSECTTVRAINCIPLPPNIDLKAAALIEPLAVGRHSITASGFRPGQSALICGAGPIGLAILLLLRVMGASKIIETEVLNSRIELARMFGADAAINPLLRPSSADTGLEPVEEAVRQAAGAGGVDVAFDATGLQSTLDLCISSVKSGGVVFNVAFNVAIHKKPLVLNLNELVMREKKLLSGICYLMEDFQFVIRLLAEDKPDDAQQMVTSVVPLSRAVEGAFEESVHNSGAHIKILIWPGY